MTPEEQFAEIRALIAETHRNLARISDKLAETDAILAETGEKLRHLAVIAEQNEERAVEFKDTFNRMGRILQIHEQRIDALEGRRPA